MAEDTVAPLELREKGEAPLHEGKPLSSHPPAQAGNLQSSGISVSKASPSSAADCYWFAQSGDSPSENKQPPEREKDGIDQDGKDALLGKDREERVRVLREKQAEERQRKLEELKTAAMQAQKFREVQEEERRRKIEEIKYKDLERRHQVEERKKQIWEAEKERRETILRKSQEREAKIEAVRNAQRSSIGFAFGSCTPRLLDLEPSMMIGRRSTSQTNVTLPSTSNGRSSASEQGDDDVVRRRTTSAFSLNHRKKDAAQRHTIHEAFSWENNWHSVVANHDSLESPKPLVPNSFSSPSQQRKFHGLSLTYPWDTDSSVQETPLFPTSPWAGDHRLSGVLTGSGVLVGEDLMTMSLTSLTSSVHRGRRKTDLIPTVPPTRESPRTRSPAAPSSPTRPQSSLSQMSLSSHTSQNSSVSLRARSAPRRQRPLSIAGSIPDKPGATEDRRGRSSEKKVAPPQSGKPPRAKSAGADQAAAAAKEVNDALEKSTTSAPSATQRRDASLSASSTPTPKACTIPAKDKPKIAPKPTVHKQKIKPPLAAIQTTTAEQKPVSNSRESTPPCQPNDVLNSAIPQVTKKDENAKIILATTKDIATTKSSEASTIIKMVPVEFEEQPLIDSLEIQPTSEPQKALPSEPVTFTEDNREVPVGGPSNEPKPVAPSEVLPEPSDSTSKVETASSELISVPATQLQLGESSAAEVTPVPPKPRITTEEEAKAAIAEKRRLAREQAEREAELERLRQEELRRQEEERLRREEEEQRLWEEEQEKARLLEQERLRRAIEEQQQKEEEERQRKEDEARQKAEKEKAERIAREEQEKQRKEAEEKLRKEEEERAERRKRVEAIMSRTRGKGGGTSTPPVTTPTKSIEPVVALTEQQECVQQAKTISNSAMQNSKEDGFTVNQQNQECVTQPDLLGNISKMESQQNVLEQQSLLKIESKGKEENGVEAIHTNGFTHHKIVDNQLNVDLIMDSQSPPERKSSSLTDNLSEFDMLAPKMEPPPMLTDVAPLIDLSLNTLHHPSADSEITTTMNDMERISNEDNVNFNITTTNGLGNPFVDNYSKHQESVTDYLA